MNSLGTLYMLPVTLGESSISRVIPSFNTEILNQIDVYIIENIKSARRFLKKSGIKKPLDELDFFVLNKKTPFTQYTDFIQPLLHGKNVGIMSDAGCPGVADPGASIVALAQSKKIKVVPLVGPSSILLGLMASGLNGQNFCFNGYIPKDQRTRIAEIKRLEKWLIRTNQTQIFIETPYRNNHMMNDLLDHCSSSTILCIAVDVTLPSEQITSMTISDWKKNKINIHKRPCIFLLGTRNQY